MKPAGTALRGLLLTAGEVPLLEDAPSGALESGVDWQARELDAFLAEVDAGGALPDLVVVPYGDPEVLRSLRRHERCCCLPLYAGTALAGARSGWDGVLADWSADAEETIRTLVTAAAEASSEDSGATLESERRAHAFARFLHSRGEVERSAAVVFGLLVPRRLLKDWREAGWVELAEQDRVRALPRLGAALEGAWPGTPTVRAERPSPKPEPTPTPPPREPAPTPSPERTPEPTTPEKPSPTPEPTPAPPREPTPEPTPGPEPRPEPSREPPPERTPEPLPERTPKAPPSPQPEVPPPPRTPEVGPQSADSRRRAPWLMPLTAALVLVLVVLRAAVDAGYGVQSPLGRLLLPFPPGESEWIPPVRGAQLQLPRSEAGLMQRLAQGDPAFRPSRAPQANAAAPPAPAVAPEPVAEAVPEPVAEAVPEPAPEPLPPVELQLTVALEYGEQSVGFPLMAGAVAEWQVEVGAEVRRGQVLARLQDPRQAAAEAELTTLREAFAAERTRRAEEAARAHAAARATAEQELRHAADAQALAATTLEEREARHQRNLQLVEEGVLGYGEIRAEWEAVLAARASAAEAERALEAAQLRVDSLAAAEPPRAAAADPLKALLLQRAERSVEDARGAALLHAPADGFLLGPLAPVGSPRQAAEVLARLRSLQATEAVATLPADAPEADWLRAEAWLQAAPGVRVPLPAHTLGRAEDGSLQFRFPWPPAAPSEAKLHLRAPR